jgi:hypothetical protein
MLLAQGSPFSAPSVVASVVSVASAVGATCTPPPASPRRVPRLSRGPAPSAVVTARNPPPSGASRLLFCCCLPAPASGA